MIIAAFAGTGKTYFCNHVEGANDFVCMPYKYYLPEIESNNVEHEKVKADLSLNMNSEYPENYINAILQNMKKYKYIIIPSDRRVLEGLQSLQIQYVLCFPEGTAKEEYRKRYIQRGNTEEFFHIFIDGWDGFMKSFRDDTYGTKIVLAENEYLLDIKDKIDKIILPEEFPIQDYKTTGVFNPYLIGSQIIDMFVLPKEIIGCGEVGLTIIFEKNKERGILIYSYNDLGEWISLLQIGNNVIHRQIEYFTYPHVIDELINKYHIET